MQHSAHEHCPCDPELCVPIGILKLLAIGTAIMAFSMLLAVVTIAIRGARASHVRLHKYDEEDGLLQDDEPLPPYEHPPPAYVAELDSGVDLLSSDSTKDQFEGASAD